MIDQKETKYVLHKIVSDQFFHLLIFRNQLLKPVCFIPLFSIYFTDQDRIQSFLEGLLFTEISDILYLEAESNYTFIFLTDGKKITVTKTLKDFEELLPSHVFIRIHHSHIINKDHIQKYIRGEGGQVIMKNGTTLYISRRKKDEFLKAIGY